MAARLLVDRLRSVPRHVDNPSGEIARRVAGSPRWRRLGIEAQALVMPTAYASIDAVLTPALAGGFDAVLMIGVADARAMSGSSAGRRTARAYFSPDVERQPPDRPDARRRSLPSGQPREPAPDVRLLRRSGLRLPRLAGRRTLPLQRLLFRRACRARAGAVPAHPEAAAARRRRGGSVRDPAGTRGSRRLASTSPSTSSAPRAIYLDVRTRWPFPSSPFAALTSASARPTVGCMP